MASLSIIAFPRGGNRRSQAHASVGLCRHCGAGSAGGRLPTSSCCVIERVLPAFPIHPRFLGGPRLLTRFSPSPRLGEGIPLV